MRRSTVPPQSSAPLGKVYEELWDAVHALDAKRLAALRRQLEPRERAILDERVFARRPKTLAWLAARWGNTRERLRQIEKGLLGKVREYRLSRTIGPTAERPRRPTAHDELRRLARELDEHQRVVFLRTLRPLERIVFERRALPSRAETSARIAVRLRRAAWRIERMERRLLRKLLVFTGARSSDGAVGAVQHVRTVARLRALAAGCEPRSAASLAASIPPPERLVMEWRALSSSPARLDAIAAELGTSITRIKSAEKRLLELLAIYARMWREASSARGGRRTRASRTRSTR
ncbi:MAG: hypothetical protein JST00_06995 [Deltaproteobacteria bacterium]|nr:hypothetical protein [Deltaproteobacteria bacterium]